MESKGTYYPPRPKELNRRERSKEEWRQAYLRQEERERKAREEQERLRREEEDAREKESRRTAIGCLWSLPLCMVVGAVWGCWEYPCWDNFIIGAFGWGGLLWLMLWCIIALVWMTIHFNDGNDDNYGGGASSGGLDWGRMANWYVRGATRRQMRKMSRW